mgnify:CR=1 FL=1
MKLIILNYNTGDIDIIRNLPDNINDLSFFIEDFGYNEDEISWMTCDDYSRVNYFTWEGDRKSELISNGFEYLDAAV